MLTEVRPDVVARRRLRAGDAVAVVITVGLAALVGLDAHSPVRTALAVAFVGWVPGSAVAAWLPRLTPAERRGVAVTMSLTISVLAPTLALWVRWSHPVAAFGLVAVASVVALVLAPRPDEERVRPSVPVVPGSTELAVVAIEQDPPTLRSTVAMHGTVTGKPMSSSVAGSTGTEPLSLSVMRSVGESWSSPV